MNKILSKTLITGADGMIGSYIDFGIKTDKSNLDITNSKQVLKMVKKYKPKVIIHLAAMTDLDLAERKPKLAYQINSVGTYNMAFAAKEVNAKFVYVSTATVFDGLKKSPYKENDIPNPQNYYSQSKYLGELIVQNLLKDYIIARSCWIFGGGKKKDKKFVAQIMRQLDKPEIKAVKDIYGSPTFGKDFVAGLKKLIIEDKKGIFHLSNEGVASRYEVAREIVKISKKRIKVIPVSASYFKVDAKRSGYEGMKSKIKFMRSWEKALKEYIISEWI
ncbi:MAG: NAD(P)-dependent oxidoreductase [Parcubacteria group bacterium]